MSQNSLVYCQLVDLSLKVEQLTVGVNVYVYAREMHTVYVCTSMYMRWNIKQGSLADGAFITIYTVI